MFLGPPFGVRRQSEAATALWIYLCIRDSALSKAPSPLRSAGALQISMRSDRKQLFLFSGRNSLHVRQSPNRNPTRARDLVNAQGLQHLDESLDFLFIARSL